MTASMSSVSAAMHAQQASRSPRTSLWPKAPGMIMCCCCRTIITDAIGGELEFEFFHRWFNSLFLLSAILTMLLFVSQHQSNRQDESAELPIWTKQPQLHRAV